MLDEEGRVRFFFYYKVLMGGSLYAKLIPENPCSADQTFR